MNKGALGNPQPLYFESGLFALPLVNNVVATVRHGLPRAPQCVRWVLVNQTAEFGFNVGDEVDTGSFDGTQIPGFMSGCDATLVFLALKVAAGASLNTSRRDTGAYITITLNKWKAKCYAWIQRP